MQKRGVLCLGLLAVAVGGCRSGSAAPTHAGPARIALVRSPHAEVSGDAVDGLRDGLNDAGLRDGQDYTWQELRDEADGAPAPDLLLAASAAALSRALRAARTTPVIFTDVAGPEAAGARPPSLARRWLPSLAAESGPPVTGVSAAPDLYRLLDAAAPLLGTRDIGVVVTSDDGESAAWLERLRAAAGRAGRPLRSEALTPPATALEAVRRLCGQGVGGIVVLGDPASEAIVASVLAGAQTCAIPVLGTRRAHALGGAVLTQTSDVHAAAREAGLRAAQALRGEDVGGLGFDERPGGMLIVNAAAAERAGIGLPLGLIEGADDVMGD